MRLRVLWSAVALGGLLGVTGREHDAEACGGCFNTPPQPTQSGTVVTDHRMIFRISPQQTTLYDEIEYTGDPSAFAWVLPIHAPVTVGLSADIVFATLQTTTATTIEAPFLPPCPTCNCGGLGSSSGSSTGGSSGGTADAGAPVTIISQQQVGPYETVQLSSTDAGALETWLMTNGFDIPADIQPIINAYVTAKFDFLALRLEPGQGIQAMRPVRVTSPGAGLTLPLRMVAAGTGSTVGVTLWVLADGRYEAQNFANFTISPSDLVWDWSAKDSNYATVRAQKERALGNAAWQTESSLDISPYNVIGPILGSDPGAMDYSPIPGDDAGADAGAGQTADEVRTADLETLFPGSASGTYTDVRITRMRGDLSRAALANDLVLQASMDQSAMSNVYQVTQSINAPTCPPLPNPCPCGGSSSSGSASGGSSGGFGASSGGTSGGGASSGGGSASSGGSSGSGPHGGTLQPGGGGCSTARSSDGGAGIELVAIGALGASFWRARRRRRHRPNV